MPFKKIDVKNVIEDMKNNDPEFKELWENSRTDYNILGELIKIRKEKGLTQSKLGEMTGNKQQVISKIEKRESSPTLKTLCSILDSLGYDIQLVPKTQ